MIIVDQRQAPKPIYSGLVAPLINDPRDAVFIGLMGQCLLFAAAGVSFYFVERVSPWFVVGTGGSVALLPIGSPALHCTARSCSRRSFAAKRGDSG